MGLMDKVKAQATQLAQKTQEAAQEGKARLDQAQANRRGDALLRQLGALVYAERTGQGTADTQTQIDQLISTISLHEQETGLNLAQSTVPSPASPASPAGQASPDTGAPSGPTAPPPTDGPAGSDQNAPGGFSTDQSFFPPPEDPPTGPGDPPG